MSSRIVAVLAVFCVLALSLTSVQCQRAAKWQLLRTLHPALGSREILYPVPGASTTQNEALFIDMPIDHFGNGNDTFKNRYWINATYYQPGGPVFLFDSGEQNAEPLLPYYLQEYHGLSIPMRVAKRYGGLAILWEHRYYGDSLPYIVNTNTTAEEWQYLTTEQALEDVVFFANNLSVDFINSSAIRPSMTPWIMIGGSYPGMRSAYLRIRNPDIIYAAFASSAPVQAAVDMSSYYKAAERSLTRNCSADWVAVTRYVDRTLSAASLAEQTQMKFNLLKASLSGPGGNTTGAMNLTMKDAEETSNLTAASVLMEPLNFYQYYGFKDSVMPFCELLETQNHTSPPYEFGLAANRGIESAFQAFLTAISELDYNAIQGTPDDPVQDRSWMRQYCTEYGFYQRGDPNNPLSIETSFRSLEWFQENCNEVFPDIPSSPQVWIPNTYGGWNMQPSNVLFTNGEFDPWRTKGLASIEPDSSHRLPNVTVPPCNQPPPGTSFFGLTHPDMVHVSDMRVLLVPDSNHTDFKTVGFYSPVSQGPFYSALALFELALDEWLPCFHMDSTGAQHPFSA